MLSSRLKKQKQKNRTIYFIMFKRVFKFFYLLYYYVIDIIGVLI